MVGKSFAEMTLDEVFELEAKYTANIGSSVVTERGVARNRARYDQEIRRSLKARKKRASGKHAA